MIKVVVAYDDNDSLLGDYFEESYNNFLQAMQIANETPSTVLRGLDCNKDNVNNAVKALNESLFVFVGLSHGDEDGFCLLTENDIYVSTKDAVNFNNSFFYTTGCNSGLNLKDNLLQYGCKIFVGYIDNSKAPLNENYNAMFIDCELYALKQFFASDNTIDELFNEMLFYTQTQIDWLFDNNEIVEAMDLQSNKDCIALFGDGTLTRQNFQVN